VEEAEARELAGRDLASEDLVVVGARRVSQTWVVSYNTRQYVETGDLGHYLTGPGPILVSDGGRVMRVPGSEPGSKSLEDLIAECERQGG
jgi:hypothetical protein